MNDKTHKFWKFNAKEKNTLEDIADQFEGIVDETDSKAVAWWNNFGKVGINSYIKLQEVLSKDVPLPKLNWEKIGKYGLIGTTIIGLAYAASQIEGCESTESQNTTNTNNIIVQEQSSGCGCTPDTFDVDGRGSDDSTNENNKQLPDTLETNDKSIEPVNSEDDRLTYLCNINVDEQEQINEKKSFELNEPFKTKGKYSERINADKKNKKERLVNHKTAPNEIAILFPWRSERLDRGDLKDISNIIEKCKGQLETCYLTVTGLSSNE